MATEIVMPQMGAEMEEGTVVRWTRKPGDYVKRGETVAEIETDKATVDLESFDEGYFLGPVVEEGITVPVGVVIGYLGAQGETLPTGASAPTPTPAPASAPTPSPIPEPQVEQQAAAPRGESVTSAHEAAVPAQQGQAAAPVGQPATRATDAVPSPERHAGNGSGPAPAAPPAREPAAGGRLRASPVARSMARELGIDLETLRGSGPDGRIMRRDVEQAAAAQGTVPTLATAPPPAPHEAPAPPPAPAPAPAPAPVATMAEPVARPAAAAVAEPLSKMRQTIARRMATSKRDIPHYYLTVSVDMTDALAFRGRVNETLAGEVRVSVNDLIVRACAVALARHPRFNMRFADNGLMAPPAINIGIAVALDDGLIVPAVLDCASKGLAQLARETRDVAERARAGHLRPAELSEGTFTVSNLGMYGVETLFAIIQPDQSAILGAGQVEPRPAVRDGEVVVRDMATLALSADHRVTDGAQGARFLAEIKSLLERPMLLVL